MLNNHHINTLEYILEKNKKEQTLIIDNYSLIFCNSLGFRQLITTLQIINQFINKESIETLLFSIVPKNLPIYAYSSTIYSKANNFLFFFFSKLITRQNQLKKMIIYWPISPSLLNKRFKLLLSHSNLEYIEIRHFNFILNKQACGKWKLQLIDLQQNTTSDNNIIYEKPELRQYIITERKRLHCEFAEHLTNLPLNKKPRQEILAIKDNPKRERNESAKVASLENLAKRIRYLTLSSVNLAPPPKEHLDDTNQEPKRKYFKCLHKPLPINNICNDLSNIKLN